MFDAFFTTVFGLTAPAALELPDLKLIPAENLPVATGEALAPEISAKAAAIFDPATGKFLWGENKSERLPIASLTKLMTAIVVRENFEMDEVVTVSRQAARQPPAKIWLREGEQITVENLLEGVLIRSGNDAALALGQHIGMERFALLMNEKAETLQLRNTHFANPVGLDDPENYSTAADLTRLAEYFLTDEKLREIVGQKSGTVYDVTGDIRHDFTSTNQLFGTYLDIQGLKTGSTAEAGECFIALAKLENGREIMAVVLDSPDRWQEAKILLDFASRNFSF